MKTKTRLSEMDTDGRRNYYLNKIRKQYQSESAKTEKKVINFLKKNRTYGTGGLYSFDQMMQVYVQLKSVR